MKKTIKSKLRLNSQTIRCVHPTGLQDVQGGYVTATCAPTWNCDTTACRACG